MTTNLNHGFSCFVTGTDTEIGKTLISCALLHGLAQAGGVAVGMKPVAAGAHLQDGVWHNEDVDLLQAHSTLQLPTELVAPYLLRTAAAPHIAARREQIEIDLDLILQRYHTLRQTSQHRVVEGVGGFLVPFSDNCNSADLAQRLGLPIILVVGMRLGCLNHALLTAEAIAARGLHLAGWVANLVDEEMAFRFDNCSALAERIDAPLLGWVPRMASPGAAAVAACLDFSRLANWPTKIA